ncbi:hypothetical protein FN846DRAFT_887956 [Sphaerosporella brunnea]|uniref:Uncharacterized protein n=1 Tax=Sphaerosporella brunnea TaxID=1250544 RepID=A0A5J5F4A3_9PEZI|nr:hypothetical protein FN846DRAFT_887956 [Sphaerosporella brunnea]
MRRLASGSLCVAVIHFGDECCSLCTGVKLPYSRRSGCGPIQLEVRIVRYNVDDENANEDNAHYSNEDMRDADECESYLYDTALTSYGTSHIPSATMPKVLRPVPLIS